MYNPIMGSNLNMPEELPAVGERIIIDTPYEERYALNFCTYSYTMSFWDWDEYEAFLDWSAMNGYNLMLDIVGQEEVLRRTLNEFGYTDEEVKEFISGPAYFAWFYMQNMTSFGGPLPDIIIDTSKYKIGDLREEMTKRFGDEIIPEKQMAITVLSFGFKYGIPVDSDLVFDVRFIPNPFYIPELKPFSGLDKPVNDYVLEQEETIEFLEKLNGMLDFLIPNYKKEGKRQLIVAIGCTGGRHRSVAIANEIYKSLHEKNYNVYIEHRDIKEDVHKGDKKL